METFANRLRALRKERNLTQLQLAKMLNVSINSYSQYELGNTEPKYENLKKLADFFCVSIDYLLGSNYKTTAGQLTDQLTPDERELLSCFNEMNFAGRDALLISARALAGKKEKIKDKVL
ncbi:MAG: helix-turn-helix transcriptional regulator [Clostridia bacterium]|nr:helix-turn-helix transcriptional regulator [Clostridia bacterium]